MGDLESSGRFLDSIYWSSVGILGLLRQVLAVDLGFFISCFFHFINSLDVLIEARIVIWD